MGRRAVTVAAVGVIIVVAMVGAWVRYRAAPSRNALTTATSVAHGAAPCQQLGAVDFVALW